MPPAKVYQELTCSLAKMGLLTPYGELREYTAGGVVGCLRKGSEKAYSRIGLESGDLGMGLGSRSDMVRKQGLFCAWCLNKFNIEGKKNEVKLKL